MYKGHVILYVWFLSLYLLSIQRMHRKGLMFYFNSTDRIDFNQSL